jgi:prepilin-type N-terminal cleavage/methylation domain-containing protein
MKRRLFDDRGFTLIEMMVAVLCFAVAGTMIYSLLNSGMILYAKNMSVNTAHQDTRRAVNRLLRDIHASVSVPQLIDGFNADGSLQVHTSNITPAAGVAFQLVALGPTYIWKDPVAPNLIMIYDNGNPPAPGSRLIVPLWGIETEITKTAAGGASGHSNVFLMDTTGNIVDQTSTAGKTPQGQGKSSNTKNNGNDVYAVCYYTDRIAYLVQNGQLRLYYRRYVNANSSGQNGTWMWLNPRNFDATGTVATSDTNGITVARDITSPTPFSAVWSNTSGVAAVNITSGGSNYPNSTTVTISGGGGSGATATATVSGKVITGVNVTNAGSGYTSIPSVSFSGGSGSGAAGTVSLTTSPTTDDRYVHVQITASDPTFNNRNYKATSSLVDADMPYRSRLCAIQ